MNFQELISKLAEIDSSVSERVTIGPDGKVTGGFKPSAPSPSAEPMADKPAEPMADKPAVVPLNKRFDPRYKPGPEPYTIDIDGKIYKWAGRTEAGSGSGEVIKIPAALIGIRGLGAVSVELGSDGMYRSVPANESQEEVPLDEVAQLRKSLGLDYFSESLDECNMPGDMMSPPKQSDSVSMNVSLNASGSGGIKDLMGILKGIEDGAQVPHDHGKDVIIGNDDFPFDEEFANAPTELYAGPEAVIPTGDDLHGQGAEAPKVNGGGNPMQEALLSELANLYKEIKEASHQEKTTMKHIKNPTAGEKKAAKDIKPGVKGYQDRVDMLKSAKARGDLND